MLPSRSTKIVECVHCFDFGRDFVNGIIPEATLSLCKSRQMDAFRHANLILFREKVPVVDFRDVLITGCLLLTNCFALLIVNHGENT